MGHKEHKKMYKSGKAWVVATLSTTAIIAGMLEGTSSVSADETTSSQNTIQVGNVSSSTAQNNNNSVVIANNTANGNNVSEKNVTTESAVTASGVENNTTNNSNSINKNSETAPSKAETTQTKTNSTPTTNQNTEAQQLNPKVANIVREAGLDPTSLTGDQVKELNKINFSNVDKSGTQLTYYNFQKIADTLIERNPRYAVPFFNASQIKNMPAAVTKDAQTGKVEALDVWDSWPVQNIKTGYVSDWNGYQLVIGMMGVPNTNDNHIYLLYNKYGDNELSHWKNAGPIFGYNANAVSQEWSGSATVNDDGSIQLFYTRVDTSDANTNHQKIASATIYLNHDNNTVSIARVANDHIVFEGDGYYYQTYPQWRSTNKGADNIAMRDAHVIEGNDGNRYLVFEASTGLQNYQGLSQIYNWINYGGNARFNIDSMFRLLSNPDMTSRASWANAAIGILRLTNDQKNPRVAQLYTPLISSPMVSDEIERPDVVKLGNKYYLFTATRLNRGSNDDAWNAADKVIGDNVAMLGYVSDHLTGGYKPLNDSGVVLTASVPANWRTATYSYYAVPIQGETNKVLITAYITNRNEVAGKGMDSTWAPSFLLQINPDNTTAVLAKMTNQGDWIWDNTSENDEMMGTAKTAALPGEKWDPTNPTNSSEPLNPTSPSSPTTPSEPLNPTSPSNPTTPSEPTSPTSPSNPTTPSEPTNPTSPSNPTTPSAPTSPTSPSNPTTPSEPTNPALPQTGNENGAAVAGLGTAAILAMFGLAGLEKRRY